jgi:tight adherence protein B
MNPIIIVGGIAALAVFLLFFGLSQVLGKGKQDVDERLERYAARPEANQKQVKEARFVDNMDKVLVKQNFAAKMATDLARADIKLTVTEYLIASGVCVVLMFMLGNILLRGPVFGLVAGVVGFFIPRFYVRTRQGGRLKAFNNQLADTVMLLANSLRSGYSLLQAMDSAAGQLPAPMSVELKRVVREIGLGISNEEAFQNLLRRINSDDLDLMITAINVQHEVGGNLAEILDKIADIIRERVRIKGEIQTLTAMQRASSYLVTGLPVVMTLIISIINPAYMSTLWTTLCGWIMLITASVMLVTGFLIIRKIVDIEV